METTQETIQTFLKQYGWESESPEADLEVTEFRGKTGVFRLFIQLMQDWVILVIVPFVPRPIQGCETKFIKVLVRANYEMNMVKIGIDNQGDVALSVELPTSDTSYKTFALALDALSTYADLYYLPLANLATDPNYHLPQELGM